VTQSGRRQTAGSPSSRPSFLGGAYVDFWRKGVSDSRSGNGRFPPMIVESASPAWRPLSRTVALASTGRAGREAAEGWSGPLLAPVGVPPQTDNYYVEAIFHTIPVRGALFGAYPQRSSQRRGPGPQRPDCKPIACRLSKRSATSLQDAATAWAPASISRPPWFSPECAPPTKPMTFALAARAAITPGGESSITSADSGAAPIFSAA
jgi:hypothetical protein